MLLTLVAESLAQNSALHVIQAAEWPEWKRMPQAAGRMC